MVLEAIKSRAQSSRFFVLYCEILALISSGDALLQPRISPEVPVDLLSPQTHSFFPPTCVFSRRNFDKSSHDPAFQTVTMSRRGILFLQRSRVSAVASSMTVPQGLGVRRKLCWQLEGRPHNSKPSKKCRDSSGALTGLGREWLKSEGLGKSGNGQVYISGCSTHFTLKQIMAVFNFDQILWKNTSLECGGGVQMWDPHERSFGQGEGWQGVQIQLPVRGCEVAEGFVRKEAQEALCYGATWISKR